MLATSGSLGERQNLSPELLNQNLHFDKIPGDTLNVFEQTCSRQFPVLVSRRESVFLQIGISELLSECVSTSEQKHAKSSTLGLFYWRECKRMNSKCQQAGPVPP